MTTETNCPTCGEHLKDFSLCMRCRGDGELDDGSPCPRCEGEGRFFHCINFPHDDEELARCRAEDAADGATY